MNLTANKWVFDALKSESLEEIKELLIANLVHGVGYATEGPSFSGMSGGGAPIYHTSHTGFVGYGAVPQLAPQLAPYATPYQTPQATPYASPYQVPGQVPQATPYLVPQPVPYVVPNATPYMTPEMKQGTPKLKGDETYENAPISKEEAKILAKRAKEAGVSGTAVESSKKDYPKSEPFADKVRGEGK